MEHLRYIKKGINALGEHYKNSKCDPNRDLKFQVIEKVYPNEDPMRLHREKFWIDRLNVMEPNGLNRRAQKIKLTVVISFVFLGILV